MITMKLKDFLKSNEKSRKIFGQKELDIIFKQLEGIKLTNSEKVRLSRDIKPKFEFINEIADLRDKFQLKKNQQNREIIRKATKTILEDKLKNKIKAILLFGSFATNTQTFRSDIDICVLFDKIDLEDATKFRIRVSGQTSDKVDVQVFNVLPEKVKKSIAKNHKILFKMSDFDNINFTTNYLKNNDYFVRYNKVFGTST